MAGKKGMRAGQDLRTRVMRAGRYLFSEQGYLETNTRQIAKRAGTSETGIYRVLSSGSGKYELLVAVHDECWQEIHDAIEISGIADRPDPRAVISGVVRIFWEACANDPQLGKMILTAWAVDRRLSRTSNESRKYIEGIYNLCRECVEKKLVNQRWSPEMLTEVILGISEGIPKSWYFPRTPESAQRKVSVDEGIRFIDSILRTEHV